MKNKLIVNSLIALVLSGTFFLVPQVTPNVDACMHNTTGYMTQASNNTGTWVQPNLQYSYTSGGMGCTTQVRNYTHIKSTTNLDHVVSSLWPNGVTNAYDVNCGKTDCSSFIFTDTGSHCTYTYTAHSTAFLTGGTTEPLSAGPATNLCN